jgi:peptide/nickel transport system substrate-binding protein
VVVGEPLAASDPAEIGGYRLLRRLGEGGMGVVYLAEAAAPQATPATPAAPAPAAPAQAPAKASADAPATPPARKVALKVIRPQLAAHREFRDRFRSEVRLASKVARFCTAPILDSDTEADQPYVVAEYVDGPTLGEVVREHGPLSGSELHALGIGVSSALTAIHRAGVVHRDLKPGNVLLSRFGPRVIDFGIARATDAITHLTNTGSLIGTPAYMAPEQLHGEPLTPATDVFAWGAVMAFAGTGRQPFGTAPEAIMYRITLGEPDLDGLDPHLLDPVRAALHKDPAKRPTAQQLLDTLHAGPEQPTLSAEPASTQKFTTLPVTPGNPSVPATHAPSAAGPKRARRTLWAGGAVALLAVAGITVAATLHRPDTGRKPAPVASAAPVRFDDRARGPAAPVPGAQRGGTVTGLQPRGWGHLDPQRSYRPDTMSMGSALLYRTLTGYADDGKGGLRLVGDLATDTGSTPDGGKTWTYTLRPGVRFAGGAPITAADVAYGVARSFAPEIDGGPVYLQNWLAGTAGLGFRQVWAGPYRTGKNVPPGVTTGTGTITFTFVEPHPEFPMVAALGTTAPVPRASDTRAGYRPVASGPYRIESATDARLVLERNPAWDPNTDPLRHAYPEKWIFESRLDEVTATQRLLRPDPADQATFAWSNVPQELAGELGANLRERALDAATPYSEYLAINNQHVTDVAVRRAINAAIDRAKALAVYRGAAFGIPSATVLPSVLPGYRGHGGLGVPVTGDPAEARRLLGGRQPELTYAYRDDEPNRKLAAYLQLALEDVGFRVTLKAVEPAEYLSAIETKANAYDLYLCTWGSDVPDAGGIFPLLFAGWAIHTTASKNTAYFNDRHVNDEIRKLQAEPDRAAAAKGYGALDERLLRDHAPIVPLFDRRHLSLRGPALGGLAVSRVYGTVALDRAHVLR